MSKPLIGKSSPYTRNKGCITLKLLFECINYFFSELKTRQSDSSQALNPASLVVFSAFSQLKNTVADFLALTNVYLVVLKVYVTHTYTNKNGE